MRRYLSLYRAFLSLNFKTALEYRVDFIMGATAMALVQGASLVSVWVVMQQIPTLNGWSLNEVMLIYGLVTLSRSFSHMFTESLWVTGGYIRHGGFDRFLVRPIHPLFHMLAENFMPEGFGNFLVGLALVIGAGQPLGIFDSGWKLIYLVIAVASGAVIFFALNLITSASAFWIIDSIPVSAAVFENFLFAHYPLTIFPKAIGFLMTWVIPYGFTSFYPAAYLLGRDVGPIVWASPVIAAVLVAIGWQAWQRGLRQYSGTGT